LSDKYLKRWAAAGWFCYDLKLLAASGFVRGLPASSGLRTANSCSAHQVLLALFVVCCTATRSATAGSVGLDSHLMLLTHQLKNCCCAPGCRH
jgi:hypothetical protein